MLKTNVLPKAARLLAAALLLVLAPAAAQAITSYSATGTITRADAGAPISVGDGFTLTFDVDTSAPLGASGGGSAAYDAVRNFTLNFTTGHFFFIGATSAYETRSPGTDLWDLFIDAGEPGASSDLPAVLNPPIGNADHFFRSVSLVFEDFDSGLYTGTPPELVAPDPADLDFRLLTLLWTSINAPSVVVDGEFDTLVRVVPEPTCLVLLSLAALGVRARRNRGQASA